MSNIKPNLLLIVVDSLRADRIDNHNSTAKTPNIDSLVKNGILFKQAISSSDGTVMSMRTIFSGLYPNKTKGKNLLHINPKISTYITSLKDFGYNTYSYAFNSIICQDRDFENKEKIPITSFLRDGIAQRILNSIELMKEPWLLYVHIPDLHPPFRPSKDFNNEKFGSTGYDRIVSETDMWIGKFLEKIVLEKTLVVLTADHGEYVPTFVREENIATFEHGSMLDKIQTDLGNLIPYSLYFSLKFKLVVLRNKIQNKIRLAKLKKLNLTPYEKRSITSVRTNPDGTGYLYDEIVHVPLVFCGLTFSPKVITQQVGIVDIFPTIAEIIKMPFKKRNVDGLSLLPLIQGMELEKNAIYLESSPIMNYRDGDSIGIRTEEYKYFRNTKNAKKGVKLFDLKKDPLEESNIAPQKPEIIEKMEQLVTDFEDLLEETSHEETSEEIMKVEQELKKLGYI